MLGFNHQIKQLCLKTHHHSQLDCERDCEMTTLPMFCARCRNCSACTPAKIWQKKPPQKSPGFWTIWPCVCPKRHGWLKKVVLFWPSKKCPWSNCLILFRPFVFDEAWGCFKIFKQVVAITSNHHPPTIRGKSSAIAAIATIPGSHVASLPPGLQRRACW